MTLTHVCRTCGAPCTNKECRKCYMSKTKFISRKRNEEVYNERKREQDIF